AFAVGTELVRLTRSKNEGRWRSLIREVRAVYSGRVTYACEAWNAKNIDFWDAVDAVGLDFYYGYPPPNATQEDTPEKNEAGETDAANSDAPKSNLEPTTEALAAFYRQKLSEHFAHAARLRKPLWLTEIGFPSHDRAIQTPHAWPDPAYAIDPDRQRKAYEALRIALAGRDATQPAYPEGMWIWKYTTALDGYEQRNYPRGFNMRGKPAEKSIARIFRQAPRARL
ncbi:MAG: hypothetical protein RIF32_13225, partial [Leptospirales bacterium]